MMEVPNVGKRPAVPLPDPDYKPGPPQPDPQNPGQMLPPAPPPMIVREPVTITERLMAQQSLGLGQTVSPQGRKASNEAPPKEETKTNMDTGAQRSTLTTSQK